MYKEVMPRFKYPSSAESRRNRFDELSWRTIVNLVRNHKVKLVGEVEEQDDEEDQPIMEQDSYRSHILLGPDKVLEVRDSIVFVLLSY